MRTISIVLFACLCLIAPGCTRVTVTRCTDADPVSGIRYSLPQPFVVVTPRSDGGIDVDVVCFPDPDRQYEVDAFTFLGKHKLDLQMAEGLLTLVTYNPDATTVAAQAIQSAGNVGQAAAAAGAAARAKSQEAAATAKADRTKLKTDLASAKATLIELQRQLAEATDPDVKKALQGKIGDTRVLIAQLEAQLGQTATVKPKAPNASGDVVTSGASSNLPRAHAPILYRIVETPGKGVALQATNYVICDGKLVIPPKVIGAQPALESSRLPAGQIETEQITFTPLLTLVSGVPTAYTAKEGISFAIQVNRDLLAADAKSAKIVDMSDPQGKTSQPTPQIRIDHNRPNVVYVQIQPTPAEGKHYEIQFGYTVEENGKSTPVSTGVQFQVLPLPPKQP